MRPDYFTDLFTRYSQWTLCQINPTHTLIPRPYQHYVNVIVQTLQNVLTTSTDTGAKAPQRAVFFDH
jgi:hypothetical protein